MNSRSMAAVIAVTSVALAANVVTANADIHRQSGGTTSTTTTTLAGEGCVRIDGVVASYQPDPAVPTPGQMPVGSTMSTILGTRTVDGRQITKKLVVAVDENTLYFSAPNPDDGDLTGFEVALARAIAEAITGDPTAIKLVTVTTDQKFEVVKDERVDMTIDVASMDCTRWNDFAAFSTAYYETSQQVLVPEGTSITGQDDLPGKRVCVTTPSSSEKFLEKYLPTVKRVKSTTRPGCLVKLQDHKVDAIVLPGSILAGLQEQDPTTTVLPDPLRGEDATSTYGIAINHKNIDLVRFVNALLERWRADDTLRRLQEASFPDRLPVRVPAPTYRLEP